MNSIVDFNVPFKKVNIYKLRFKAKLCTTFTLRILIFVKNSLINRFIKSQDPQIKKHHHVKYMTYRNILSAVQKKRIHYYIHYFQINRDNIKSLRNVKKLF